jgi:L-alanine-DL-glutamate epimerase-like enolase superfamily enzyme
MASTPNFRYANQAYGALLADDVTTGFGGGVETYVDGCVPIPTAPGPGVQLDPERVQRYAELYARSAADVAFTDPRALTSAHALPKR